MLNDITNRNRRRSI